MWKIKDEFERYPDVPPEAGKDDPPLVIARPGSNRERLVVLVHGLGGDRYSTWCATPRWLFADLAELGVDIGLFGYASGLKRLGRLRTPSPERQADVLASAVREGVYDQVALVGHSMGGLICKAAVRRIAETTRESLSRVVGVVLVATPSSGSLSVPPLIHSWSKDLRVLRANSELIDSLSRFWNSCIATEQPTEGKHFLPTYAIVADNDALVHPNSARSGLDDEHVLDVKATHKSVCKPTDREDPHYKWLRAKLIKILSGPASVNRLSRPEGASLEPGRKAPGDLRIVEIAVTDDRKSKTCSVDFWVSNDGGSQVVITRASFEVLDTGRGELIRGPMRASGAYDLDLTELREVGQSASCLISHEINPGKSDRFKVNLKAERLGTGVFAAWVLRPTLVTNFEDVTGREIEVWLPFNTDEITFDELKDLDRMERLHGRHLPDDTFANAPKSRVPAANPRVSDGTSKSSPREASPQATKEEVSRKSGDGQVHCSEQRLADLVNERNFERYCSLLEGMDLRGSEPIATALKRHIGKPMYRTTDPSIAIRGLLWRWD